MNTLFENLHVLNWLKLPFIKEPVYNKLKNSGFNTLVFFIKMFTNSLDIHFNPRNPMRPSIVASMVDFGPSTSAIIQCHYYNDQTFK